ncbi:MAG: flagellar protein FlgN [Lachnospiraceae bacterium]|nr:flagellar protein FlgN [Lachnospiraceae bacterium]
MSENYIAVLKQSLKKKIELLDTIAALNVLQKQMLENPELEPQELEGNIERKAELVEQLNALDDGFEQVYGRVKEELNTNRQQYAQDIREMKADIAHIMDRSATIQSQEQRNKALAEKKFSAVRKQIKEVKQSRKAVNTYYKNMMKMNFPDPEFLDNKK